MTSVKTIAIAQIRKNFSRYFTKDVKIEYQWNENANYNDDDDVILIQTEETIYNNPLNGSTNVDYVNSCSESECNNRTIETNSMSKISMIERTSDEFQLAFDPQKENENISVHGEKDVSQRPVDRKNSTEDLLHVLEGVVECKNGNEQVPKETTDEFISLVDFWTGHTEDEADGTMENLILELQSLNSTNQPSSPVVADVKKADDIDGNITKEELCQNLYQILNEPTATAENIAIVNQKDNETAQTFVSIQKTKDSSDKVVQQATGSEKEELSNIGQKQLEPNDETKEIYVAVDVKENTTLNQEVNNVAENSLISAENVFEKGNDTAAGNVAEGVKNAESGNDIENVNDFVNANDVINANEVANGNVAENETVKDISKTVGSMSIVQNKQQISDLHTAISLDEPFVFDFENNITSANYGIIYEVVQDPNDPTLFSLQAASSTTVTNLVLNNDMFVQNTETKRDLSTVSWKFDSSGELSDRQKQLLPICFVLLKDCLVKKRKSKLLDNMEFFQKNSAAEIFKPASAILQPEVKQPEVKQLIKKPKLKRTKPQKVRSKPENVRTDPKKMKTEQKSVKSNATKIKRHIVISAANNTQKPLDNSNNPTISSLQTIDAEKKSSINDWLQESSQVASPITQDNNMDVDALLQDANLFISSDIEDDAFQLASFLEYVDQTNNESQNVASAGFTTTNIPQQQSDERSWHSSHPLNPSMTTDNDLDQPLDLSMKQTTPMSNDTGYHSSKEVGIGVSRSRNVTNSYIEHRNPVYVHRIDEFENYKFTGNSLKRTESVEKPNLSSLPQLLTTGDVTCEPIQAAKTIDNKRKISPVNFSLPKKKVRHIAEPTEFTLEEETHKKESILPTRPSRTDCRRESNDYSTDLDYEPSEDEAEDIHEKSFHEEVNFPDNFNQKNYTTQSTEADRKNEPNKKWERLLIKLPNNVKDSSRVVVVAGTQTPLSNTNVGSKKCTTPTHINIVEPLPTIISSPKSKTFTVTMPNENLQNGRMTSQVSLSGKELLKRQMIYLFNRPCFHYLNGRDCGVACNFNHDLPPVREIFEKMMLFTNETIMYMYSNFIAKNNIAFITYFPTICDIFGSKKMESSLLNAIKDCEHRDKIPFFKYIYEGLVKTESSKRDALTKIIDSCVKNKNSYNVFLEIIIETDPLYFVDMLNKYFRLVSVGNHHMLKLLRQVMDNPAPSLLTVFIDMLDKYSMSDVCDIGTFKFLFSKCKQMVKDDITMSKRLNEITLRRK